MAEPDFTTSVRDLLVRETRDPSTESARMAASTAAGGSGLRIGPLPPPRLGLDRRSLLSTLSATLVAGAALATSDSEDDAMSSNRQTPPPAEDARPRMEVQRLGWAGLRIRLGESTVLVDPLADRALWGGAFADQLVPIATDPGVKALVTHLHGDHFDPVALEAALDSRGEVVCLDEVAPIVASRGFRTRPVRRYEPLLAGGLSLVAVPASDGFGIPQVSWIVSGGGRRIIHCGDTLWHGSWWEIGALFGPFDLAFLPINGFRFLGREPDVDVPSSMTPEQAVAAASVLRATEIVPIHYGLEAPFYREEPDALTRLQRSAGATNIGLRLLPPGAWVD